MPATSVEIPEALVLALADEPDAEIIAVYAEDGGVTVLFTIVGKAGRRVGRTAKTIADVVTVRPGFLV